MIRGVDRGASGFTNAARYACKNPRPSAASLPHFFYLASLEFSPK